MLKKCGYTLLLLLLNLQTVHSDEPTPADWQLLKEAVGGRLIEVSSPLKECTKENCSDIWKLLENPFIIQEHPWGPQSTGWLDAWTSSVSVQVVAAESTQDIVAAINFARKHNIKLVIKGAGHDYLGRSNAPDSLLIWTHNMRDITTHDSFIPKGAPSSTLGLHAVTVQAGGRWVEVYDAVTTKNHRYVQGGGCTTVGAAGGFLQGGGFGSFSKKYGIGAESLLEAEIVIANGNVLIANEYQNADLFWAIKGGGGGTFGVVSKVTLQTHDLPNYFGIIQGKVKANTDDAYKNLIEYFIHFYRENLFNENWGEQAVVKPDNSLDLLFLFLGMTEEEAKNVWKLFRHWVENRPDHYTIETSYTVFPAYKFWDLEFWKEKKPDFVKPYKDNLYYWTLNQGEVSAFWYAYHSRWLPSSLFEKTNTKKFSETAS